MRYMGLLVASASAATLTTLQDDLYEQTVEYGVTGDNLDLSLTLRNKSGDFDTTSIV